MPRSEGGAFLANSLYSHIVPFGIRVIELDMPYQTANVVPPTVPNGQVVARVRPSAATTILAVGGFGLAGVQVVILLVLAWVLPHNPHTWSGMLGFITLADIAARVLMTVTLIAASVFALRRSKRAIWFAIVWICLHLVWVPIALFAFAAKGEPSPEGVMIVLAVMLLRMPPTWAPIVGMAYWMVPIAIPLVQIWRIAVRTDK